MRITKTVPNNYIDARDAVSTAWKAIDLSIEKIVPWIENLSTIPRIAVKMTCPHSLGDVKYREIDGYYVSKYTPKEFLSADNSGMIVIYAENICNRVGNKKDLFIEEVLVTYIHELVCSAYESPLGDNLFERFGDVRDATYVQAFAESAYPEVCNSVIRECKKELFPFIITSIIEELDMQRQAREKINLNRTSNLI